MDSRRKTLILCASVATVGTASFAIYQLARVLFSVVRESEIEATKLLASVTAQIQSDNPGNMFARHLMILRMKPTAPCSGCSTCEWYATAPPNQ